MSRRRRTSADAVLILLPWLVFPLFACAGSRANPAAERIGPDELLVGASLGGSEATAGTLASEEQVLAVSEEMRRFLEQHVTRDARDDLKLRQLVSAIIDSQAFGVEYDDATRTASETFRMRRGNCLSFSNLFVAMARHVGLIVEFQEVDVPPDWTLDNDTYVLNQHVNVFVDLGLVGRRVVDFNIGDFKASYEMRRISDQRALAHYYNNVGVERMQAGDTPSALASFQRALAAGVQYSPAWTNLGTLYLRNGDAARAEAAYLQALKVSPTDLVAMSDLARLYERTGNPERAAFYERRVLHHRMLNPYYRYELARRAYSAQHHDDAIGHLKYAIRKRPREDSFYFLLGLTYLQKGDADTARYWLARAREVAATDALKRKYSSKIDILLRRGAGSH